MAGSPVHPPSRPDHRPDRRYDRQPVGASDESVGASDGASDEPVVSRPVQRPVALLYGPGLRIVHANPPFRAMFGDGAVGLPAAEALLDLPARAFEVIGIAYAEGRPVGCWVTLRGELTRLTVVPRRDIESNEVYGVAIRLAPRA